MPEVTQTFLTNTAVYAAFLFAGLMTGWLARGRSRGGNTAVSFEGTMRAWQRMTHAAEGALLDNVAATTPWLAPAIPAAIAYQHMIDHLSFEPWLAFVGALVIEFLGLAAVHTTFQLWSYNQQRNRDDEEAPVSWALGAAAFYLLVVVLVNVLLETAANAAWLSMTVAQIAAKALLSLLSIDAAFVLALRTQHAHRQSEKEERDTVRRQAVELGHLRKKLEKAETAVKEAREERKTAVAECRRLETETDRLERRVAALQQERDGLKQLETELEQARNTAVSSETARKQLETVLEQLPAHIRAAAVYVNGGGTMRELAERYGTSAASISRAKADFWGNGNGGE